MRARFADPALAQRTLQNDAADRVTTQEVDAAADAIRSCVRRTIIRCCTMPVLAALVMAPVLVLAAWLSESGVGKAALPLSLFGLILGIPWLHRKLENYIRAPREETRRCVDPVLQSLPPDSARALTVLLAIADACLDTGRFFLDSNQIPSLTCNLPDRLARASGDTLSALPETAVATLIRLARGRRPFHDVEQLRVASILALTERLRRGHIDEPSGRLADRLWAQRGDSPERLRLAIAEYLRALDTLTG